MSYLEGVEGLMFQWGSELCFYELERIWSNFGSSECVRNEKAGQTCLFLEYVSSNSYS